MAKGYLLTLTSEANDDAAMEIITEDDAMDILASFGAIDYHPGTFTPKFADFYVLRCKMERGEAAKFYYDDIVDGTPMTGTLVPV